MRWLALAVVAGCGGLSPDEFQAELLDATCDYYVRCGTFASVADCHARFDKTLTDNPSVEGAIDAKKLVFDEDTAHACLDALATLTCDVTMTDGHELDICQDVFTGTVAMGGTCAFNGECETENCMRPNCPMACCQGTCGAARVVPGVGQPCPDFVCGDGAYCGVDTICHPQMAGGAPCDSIDGCLRGLYCAGLVAMTPGTCTAIPHLGQPCDFVGGCAELGAVCTGTCVEAGLPGDACTTRSQCSLYYNCDGTHCVPYPTLGMTCMTTCSDVSWCNTTTMKCEAAKANGATCTYPEECESHFCSRNTCSDVPRCI